MAPQNRRTFLATLGGSALTLAGFAHADAALPPLFAAGRAKLSKIGIQLYTVRRQAMTDLTGTLEQLGHIGFKEIEFWGSFKQTPAEIRQVLDTNGLTSPSVHIGLPANPDGLTMIFESAKVMGHEWIIVASPPFALKTIDDWKKLASTFNDAGAKAKTAGFRFGFHNHTEGFKKIDDLVPFEVLLAETNPDLVSFELDIHWAYAGGADAIDLLTRHANRFKMVHVKDSSGAPDFKQADVGAGTYPWAKIFEVARRAGVEHYFIEHDSPADPMIFAKNSYDYLSHLEF